MTFFLVDDSEGGWEGSAGRQLNLGSVRDADARRRRRNAAVAASARPGRDGAAPGEISRMWWGGKS